MESCRIETNAIADDRARVRYEHNLYAFADFRDPGKTLISRGLIESIDKSQPSPIISTQVLNEFASLCIKRKYLPQAELLTVLSILQRMRVISVTESIISAAVVRCISNQINYYDALIVETAIIGGAEVLYTEDLNHNQRFGPLKIVNPFL